MSVSFDVDHNGLECRPAARRDDTLVKRPIHLTVTRLSKQTLARLALGKVRDMY
jgi:hypothetical protein